MGVETKVRGQVLVRAAGCGAAALTKVEKPQEERKFDGENQDFRFGHVEDRDALTTQVGPLGTLTPEGGRAEV